MKRIRLIFIILVVLALASSIGCDSGQLFAPKQYKETQFFMDTIIEVTAYGSNAETAVQKAMAEFKRIQDLTNQFDENSQVSKINAMAGKEPVSVDKDIIFMLKQACNNSEKFAGAIDATIGPLTSLWGVGHKEDFVPSQEEIETLLPLVDYRQLVINDKDNTVFLPKPGMRLDLGAIAKEYANRQAAIVLKENGIKSALLNAGGDIRVIGPKPDGNPWRIGVQDPRKEGGIIARIAMTEWDIIETSGDYQRFFEKDGVRYSHILDPHTGKQPGELAGVTVIASSADDSYMLGTALFVLGVEKGRELLKQFPNVQVIWITTQNQVIFTPGLEGKIELE